MNSTTASLRPQGARRRHREGYTVAALLTPIAVLFGVSFILPLLWLLRMSFNEGTAGGVVLETFTFDTYSRVFQDHFYQIVTGNTIGLGVVVMAFAVVMSIPIALFLHRTTSRWKGILLALAIAPLLISQVIRTYGWMVILGDQGVVNQFLLSTGIVQSPLALANNSFGATVALIEILMPYAIVGMLAGLGQLNPDLEFASRSLGAGRWATFRKVTLPLALPGILTACLLVFVITISAFVTPRLVGGGRVFLIATEIYNESTVNLDWPLAAALSIILLILFGFVVAIITGVTRLASRRAS